MKDNRDYILNICFSIAMAAGLIFLYKTVGVLENSIKNVDNKYQREIDLRVGDLEQKHIDAENKNVQR